MKTLAMELQNILDHEAQLHERLLQAAQSMNAAIKTEQLDAVQTACRAYDMYTCQIEAAEEKRLDVSDRIARQAGVSGRLNLARTVDLFEPALSRPLAETGTKLRAVIGRLHQINGSNRILLEESLKTIAKTFEIISVASSQFRGYKHLGTKDSSKTARTIINTVA